MDVEPQSTEAKRSDVQPMGGAVVGLAELSLAESKSGGPASRLPDLIGGLSQKGADLIGAQQKNDEAHRRSAARRANRRNR